RPTAGPPSSVRARAAVPAQLVAALAELVEQPGSFGMRIAVRRDLVDRLEALRPGIGYSARVARLVFGPHDGAPQLLGSRFSAEAFPRGSRRRKGISASKLELREQVGGVDDLRAHFLDQGDVDPPVVTPGERLTANQLKSSPQVGGR